MILSENAEIKKHLESNTMKKTISVCICTFKRPSLLKNLLCKLEEQKENENFQFNVVVVDNDPDKSAEHIINEVKKLSILNIVYFHEPERSISLARNKCVKESKGDFIAFIDDDEFAENDWLQHLFNAINKYSADGVLGPVKPHVDDGIPKWLIQSGLLDRKRFNSGYVIKNPSHTRTGNVILKSEIFETEEVPFDPKYGKVGGGDVDFFHRMMNKNKKFVWCDEAVVYEIISPDRRTRSYYIKRSFTRGLTNALKFPFLSLGTLKSIVAIPIYILIMPLCALAGQHLLIKYLVKFCDHFGKILGYIGIHVVKERPYK